ncbi:2'-5' RNA ligase family protein [Lutibacter flavus]
MLEARNLYYIGLLPHFKLRKEVKVLKEELMVHFNTKSALKSPAHITLQKPFKFSKIKEHFLIETLKHFAEQQNQFNINLNGFGCFSRRVIFIDVTNHKPVLSIHAELKKLLFHELEFKENEISSKIYPHITIATRDLSKENFDKAWPLFEFRKFKASFLVNSLFLLKHNGKFWDIYKEFQFKNK